MDVEFSVDNVQNSILSDILKKVEKYLQIEESESEYDKFIAHVIVFHWLTQNRVKVRDKHNPFAPHVLLFASYSSLTFSLRTPAYNDAKFCPLFECHKPITVPGYFRSSCCGDPLHSIYDSVEGFRFLTGCTILREMMHKGFQIKSVRNVKDYFQSIRTSTEMITQHFSTSCKLTVTSIGTRNITRLVIKSSMKSLFQCKELCDVTGCWKVDCSTHGSAVANI